MQSASINQAGRRKPSHGVFISASEPTIIFLTVCTKNRSPWLACDQAHLGLLQAWQEADAWMVGRYVLMPDHLHLFCAPQDAGVSLESWVHFWKGRFTRIVKNKAWRWQAQHWDTRLRRDESYAEKWEYVLQNPMRAGLVSEKGWPYCGELDELRWW